MNIVVAGNYDTNGNGRFYHDSLQRLVNGFTRLGHNVFCYQDREIARAATIFPSKRFGVGAANRRLIETCRNLQPPLLLLGHCDLIRNRTLDEVRRAVPGIRIAYRNVDPLSTRANADRIRERAAAVDATSITTAGAALQEFARGSGFVAFMPNPVDASIDTERSFERSDQVHDVFFAGRPVAGRDQLLSALRKALPDLRWDLHGFDGRPYLGGRDYFLALSNAKIGLNLNRSDSGHLYSSDRMAHYTGNGLLTVVARATGFDALYAEDELAFYESADDLVECIARYVREDDARRRVAEKGWRKAHACFNERLVAKYIIELTFGLPLSEPYHWPTAVYRAG